MREVPRSPGRPKSLSSTELMVLKETIETRPDIGLRELANVLVERCGKHAAPATVARGLKEIGIHKVPARKVQMSSEERPTSKTTRYQAIHRREPTPGRYPSSLTDHEWQALCAILEPEQHRGRPRVHERRAMWDAVFYLVRGGGAWRMLPSDLPPYKAVFAFFARARDSGLLERVYDHLHALWRERSGRNEFPSAGAVDSQSVKTTEKGGSAVSTRGKR
jgi:transposase